jgi:hypothetical protein
MLLSNTVCFVPNLRAANALLQAGRTEDSPPILALTRLLPAECLIRLAPMRHAIFDFDLVPEAEPPRFVRTLTSSLEESCVIDTNRPGVVEAFLVDRRISAAETLVAFGPQFDPGALPPGMTTINLLVVDRDAFAGKVSSHLQELWSRSTVVVALDRLDQFAEAMADSRR